MSNEANEVLSIGKVISIVITGTCDTEDSIHFGCAVGKNEYTAKSKRMKCFSEFVAYTEILKRKVVI